MSIIATILSTRHNLRLSIAVSAVCGWGVIVSLFLLASHPFGRDFLTAFGVPWFYLFSGICLLFSLVLSIVSLRRSDWFGLIGLLPVLLAALLAVVVVLAGLKSEM